LLHADLYRLLDDQKKLEREVANLGLRDRLREGAMAILEWGDSTISFLGRAPRVRVTFEISDEKRSARVFD
jgi:tRNA A37 threonylcarbamoyladenosine biosynthesis protein TsaE